MGLLVLKSSSNWNGLSYQEISVQGMHLQLSKLKSQVHLFVCAHVLTSQNTSFSDGCVSVREMAIQLLCCGKCCV